MHAVHGSGISVAHRRGEYQDPGVLPKIRRLLAIQGAEPRRNSAVLQRSESDGRYLFSGDECRLRPALEERRQAAGRRRHPEDHGLVQHQGDGRRKLQRHSHPESARPPEAFDSADALRRRTDHIQHPAGSRRIRRSGTAAADQTRHRRGVLPEPRAPAPTVSSARRRHADPIPDAIPISLRAVRARLIADRTRAGRVASPGPGPASYVRAARLGAGPHSRGAALASVAERSRRARPEVLLVPGAHAAVRPASLGSRPAHGHQPSRPDQVQRDQARLPVPPRRVHIPAELAVGPSLFGGAAVGRALRGGAGCRLDTRPERGRLHGARPPHPAAHAHAMSAARRGDGHARADRERLAPKTRAAERELVRRTVPGLHSTRRPGVGEPRHRRRSPVHHQRHGHATDGQGWLRGAAAIHRVLDALRTRCSARGRLRPGRVILPRVYGSVRRAAREAADGSVAGERRLYAAGVRQRVPRRAVLEKRQLRQESGSHPNRDRLPRQIRVPTGALEDAAAEGRWSRQSDEGRLQGGALLPETRPRRMRHRQRSARAVGVLGGADVRHRRGAGGPRKAAAGPRLRDVGSRAVPVGARFAERDQLREPEGDADGTRVHGTERAEYVRRVLRGSRRARRRRAAHREGTPAR